MDYDIKKLSDELRLYDHQLYVSYENDNLFKAPKLLEEDMQSFDPNTLYVGNASTLIKVLPVKCPANILVIPDIDIGTNDLNKFNVNLIVLNKNENLMKVFNEVYKIITSQYEFVPLWEAMLKSFVNSKGVQDIIDIGYELLGNPISLGDVNGILVAYKASAELLSELGWDVWVEKGKVPYDSLDYIKFKRNFSMINESDSPIHIKETGKYEAITGKVVIDNNIEGYLTVIGAKKPFKEYDIDLVSLLCSVVSSELQKHKAFYKTNGTMLSFMITDLLDGKIKDDKRLEKMAKLLGLKLRGNLYVLTISLKQKNPELGYVNYLLDFFENTMIGAKSILYDDCIVILISNSKGNPLSDETMNHLIEFMIKNDICGGLSRCFHDLIDMPYFYKQSLKAIELGMQRSSEEVFFTYEDNAIYHLLSSCSKQEDLEMICHPSLSMLIEYDKYNGTNYTHTLHTYLLNKGNLTDSANALHIHRTTMVYRYQKIQSLMEIDLHNMNTMLHLYLSFIILRFINKLDYNTLACLEQINKLFS
ncbi:purine catabolism regulatory protein [Oxobacter pfennigii]|uniref:Purine catabolism regulatory protein n=1 Tax=Oxobacter pfennigii TaxID=36849 RepID=A0A0P9AG73_9CLOT|nr:helix-turn-helix domain-containing protein [Oxobacter pfennigii]KPU44403.1 purine catabolism regulatory protein [Oxobacter pfennigii]